MDPPGPPGAGGHWRLEDNSFMWDPRNMHAPPLHRCIVQVPQCGEVLDSTKLRPYNIRYRLCMEHLRALSCVIDGVAMRFCQKCSRFHTLDAFEGTKHTCQMMLERHNSRRRERAEGTEAPAPSPRVRSRAPATSMAPRGAGGSAGPDDLWPIPDDFMPSGLDDVAAMERFLMSSDSLGGLLNELPAEPAQTQGAFAAALLGAPMLPPPLPSPAAPGAPLPPWPAVDLLAPYAQPPPAIVSNAAALPMGAAGAVAPELLRTVVAHIKLHDCSPYDLPRGLADMVHAWLGGGVLDALAYVRPGCTLLTVHALARGGVAVAPGGAPALLAALKPLQLGRIDVHLDAPGADAEQLPPMRPLAVCSSAPAVVCSSAQCAVAGTLRVYIGGAMLRLQPDAAVVRAGVHARCTLPVLHGASGLVLLELESAGVSRLRPIVLASDAAIAAEMAALGAAADGGTRGCTQAEVEAAALAIGGALAPGAAPQLLRLAVAIAARHALHATLLALLQRLTAAAGLAPRTLDGALRLRLRVATAAACATLACVQYERGIFAPSHALEEAAELLALAPLLVRVDAIALLALVLNERLPRQVERLPSAVPLLPPSRVHGSTATGMLCSWTPRHDARASDFEAAIACL